MIDKANDYIKDNGLAEESQYQYTAQFGQCKYESSIKAYTISNHSDVPQDDNDASKSAIAKTLVSAAIDATLFQHYKKSIFDKWDCGTQLNHGVLAVGYGSEEGCFRFARKDSGTCICGISMEVSHPNK